MMKSSGRHLARLLNSVAQKEPVDAGLLSRLLVLEGFHFSQFETVFGENAQRSGTGLLCIRNQEQFDQLRAKYPVGEQTRAAAALTGDSHRFRLSGGIAVIDGTLQASPQVCVVRDGAVTFPRPFGRELVVFENEELYLQRSRLLVFLAERCALPPSADLDLMFGMGNRAASQAFAAIYAQYDRIWMLLDVDLGGLAIFRNTVANTGANARFLLPGNIEQLMVARAAAVRPDQRLSSAEKARLSALARSHPEIERVANLIHRFGVQLEQEVYLTEVAGDAGAEE